MKFIFMLLLLFSTNIASGSDVSNLLGKIPIQSGGRVKPFDTFAKESLRLIHGRAEYNNQSAVVVVFTWVLAPNQWYDTELIEIPRHDLKENLDLDEKKYFSLNEITNSSRLSLILQELQNKIDTNEKLDNYQKAVRRLDSQLILFNSILSGNMALVPFEDKDWLPIVGSDSEILDAFSKIVEGFSKYLQDETYYAQLESHVDYFVSLMSLRTNSYPSNTIIEAEVHYNLFHPFRWSYVFYLLASLLFLIYFSLDRRRKNKWWLIIAWSFLTLGFLLNTYGFILRVYLTGRPPVSNMYESVIWVAWGSVFFASIFEFFKRVHYFAFAATLVSVICLITADIAPVVLDPSLAPLQPVLRSNLWLIVHVMTITLAYSAFFLSFVLSDIGLWFYLKKKKAQMMNIAQFTYRATQLGVVLLIAGTVLGGVWADYSWGRFWGWDPKETWALIAILGYIAVLHARLVGWIRGFGFLVTNSFCFILIIMAWYGVNYILGAGLHSYGFGGGGVGYVTTFVSVQLIYLCLTLSYRYSNK